MTNTDLPAVAGVDLDRVLVWMDDCGLGHGPFTAVNQLVGGTQNILVQLTRAESTVVLRRGPLHLRPASNDVLRREARLLGALNNTDVKAPRLLAADLDGEVLGVVSYLMTAIDGLNAAGGLPSAWPDTDGVRHRMGLSAIEGLAALANVDHVALGLSDYGKPDGFLERQVARWMRELETYNQIEGYGGPEIPGLDEVAAWLGANLPTPSPAGIMHGDFHLANLLFHRNEPELAAIVDWEMSTIGDPLVDLGWILATWPGDEGLSVGPAMAFNGISGFARPDELVAHYAALTGRDVSAIDFYVVLACFKLGIILEGTHARASAGRADKGVGDLLHAITVALFDKATTVIHGR